MGAIASFALHYKLYQASCKQEREHRRSRQKMKIMLRSESPLTTQITMEIHARTTRQIKIE
jgi:hypothetical protein